MLTTMTHPDAGTGRVGGLDVVARRRSRPPDHRRDRPGRHPRRAAHRHPEPRAGRQLSSCRAATRERGPPSCSSSFELTDAAGRMVKTYSGGMRRRLDLAASLMARPPVLFLDEPTTGLDPTSRQRMWEVIRGLVADGTTVLLTTQYLDEADALADRISVIDHGTRHRRRHRPRAQGARRRRAARGHALAPAPRGRRARSRRSVDGPGAASLDDGRRLRGAGRRRARASPPRSSARSTTPASRSTTSRSTTPRSTTCSSRSPVTRRATSRRRRLDDEHDTDELDGGLT